MSIMLHLSSLALRGAAEAAGNVLGFGDAGRSVAEGVTDFLSQRFIDHSQRLNKALARSTDRAWRAVEIALAGNTWWDRCKRTLSTAEERAFREQVQTFLKANPLDGVDGFGANFRDQCLAQLQATRKAGLLKPAPTPPDELARQVDSLARFGDPVARLDAEYRSVAVIASQLRQHGYDALATFLELRPASGPPVLASAVRYFFQREVENDRELFQGLAYAQLDCLAKDQSAGFAALAAALDEHGERLEALLADVHAAVVQTRADVLDVKAELQRQGQQMQDLGDAVLRALQQHHLEKRSLHTSDSLSVRDEDERRLVKDLVRRYRALPASERKRMPALLNAVGKLQVVAGDFESAERDFRELAEMVPDAAARAEAAHNAYLTALERRAWPEALAELKQAAHLDPDHFAPFPLEKFEPERILGAGGFGVAFLCRNTRSGGRVVIKTLRSDGLDRDMREVFREAQTLEELDHPAIIRVRDCDFAGAGRARPYLVMDFFQGRTLAEHVEENGPLPVNDWLPLARLTAEGLRRAHERGILHRDVKPANLLVRKASFSLAAGISPMGPIGPMGPITGGKVDRQSERWEAKIIDFGLALRAETQGSTQCSSVDHTLAGSSIAGTREYAAPEQMGKLKGVAVGTYSDVFGFGKTSCFALFGTAQPTFQHWQQIPRELADLLGRCLDEQPSARPRDFAAVLHELDRLTADRPRSAPARILDSQPVKTPPHEQVPVLEEVKPEHEPRRRPRREPRLDELEEVAPPQRRGNNVRVLAVLLLFIGLPVIVLGWAIINRGQRGHDPLHNPWVPPNNLFSGIGIPGMGEQTKADPINPRAFEGVLFTLQNKPSTEKLRELAGRLAETVPTEDQRKKHAAVKQMRELKATKPALEQAELDDDILIVSRALNALLAADTQPRDKLLAAQAMQQWGTEDNVEFLIPYIVNTDEQGIFNRRVHVARALGAIGDKRGIPPVVARMNDTWDIGHGLIPAIIAFGPAAEPEVRKQLNSDKLQARRAACDVLKEIGTEASIPDLEKLAADPSVKNVANAAIAAIKARQK